MPACTGSKIIAYATAVQHTAYIITAPVQPSAELVNNTLAKHHAKFKSENYYNDPLLPTGTKAYG